ILEQCTVHCFKRQSSRIVKHAVGYCDVFEATIRLSTKLDSACWTKSPVSVSKLAFLSSIKKCPFVIAANLTICDYYFLGGPCKTGRKRTLRTNAVVERRV